MDACGPKRRKLNYDKCAFCRKDKKRCDPSNRQWPQKCDRCEELGFACSESKNLKAIKVESATTDGAAIGEAGNFFWGDSQYSFECQKGELEPTWFLRDEDSQWFIEYQRLELEMSWLRRCEDYVASIESTNVPGYSVYNGRIVDIKADIKQRKNRFPGQVEQLLCCSCPMARHAARSMIPRVINFRSIDHVEKKTAESEETLESEATLRTLLNSAPSADWIDNELSMRESLLHAMITRKATDEEITNDVRNYEQTCARYTDHLKQIPPLGCAEYPDYDKVSFPFNGDTRILRLLVRHSSEFLFSSRDIFSNNALLAAFLIAKKEDVNDLVRKMDKAKFLKLASKGGANKSTILHVAAIANMTCVFERVKKIGYQHFRAAIDSKDMDDMTPLSYAASHGNFTIVEALLDMEANTQLRNEREENAVHWAVLNGHKDITRILIHRNPILCTVSDVNGYNPIELAGHIEHELAAAGEHEHPGIIDPFFSDTFRDLLDLDDDVGVEVYMDLLRVGFIYDRPEVMKLLSYENFLDNIDQTSRQRQTALQMAAGAGNLDSVNFLLHRGADASIRDIFDDKTACDYAREHGHPEVVSVLQDLSTLAISQ